MNMPIAPDTRRLLAAAWLGITLLAAGVGRAEDAPVAHEPDVTARGESMRRGIDKPDIRRGHVRDADGDGHADAAVAAGGKALADVVKHSDRSVGAARLGDPIPDIDMSCAPSCTSAPSQADAAVPGTPRQRAADSDATEKSVPALEANPLP